jgi:RNA polymerase sigma-70 factor (ECF subfamily)
MLALADSGRHPVETVAMDESPTIVRIEDLIARLQRGEAAARDELLACAWQRLERLARKMLGDFPVVRRWDGTGDVLNEAAMRLCRALQDKPPDDALHFFRLAALQVRRELIDLARHYKNRPDHIHLSPAGGASGSDGPAEFDPPDGTPRDPSRLEVWTDFHQAIDRLPDRPREVFELIWYHGLPQAEAARLLGVCVRTVKSHWMEARLRLCDALDGRMPG